MSGVPVGPVQFLDHRWRNLPAPECASVSFDVLEVSVGYGVRFHSCDRILTTYARCIFDGLPKRRSGVSPAIHQLAHIGVGVPVQDLYLPTGICVGQEMTI
jgi:hypothetical protein